MIFRKYVRNAFRVFLILENGKRRGWEYHIPWFILRFFSTCEIFVIKEKSINTRFFFILSPGPTTPGNRGHSTVLLRA